MASEELRVREYLIVVKRLICGSMLRVTSFTSPSSTYQGRYVPTGQRESICITDSSRGKVPDQLRISWIASGVVIPTINTSCVQNVGKEGEHNMFLHRLHTEATLYGNRLGEYGSKGIPYVGGSGSESGTPSSGMWLLFWWHSECTYRNISMSNSVGSKRIWQGATLFSMGSVQSSCVSNNTRGRIAAAGRSFVSVMSTFGGQSDDLLARC